MGDFRLGPGEQVQADLTAPLRTMVFPVLELVAMTGIFWIGIGWLDRGIVAVDMQQRNLVVLLWMALVVWRFIVPLLRSRRQRFILTNHRILVRAPKLRAPLDSIALRDVRGAARRRGGISLAVAGYRRPMFFPQIPRAKKVAAMIETHAPYCQQIATW
ncbi:hypothetical protein GP475_03080 [Corynebacterium poyangense]|uniref:Uncharacterized protein n=1 Tax=Corynebacterium poyangense TaxID=2684405 RepID=A0A7H0SMG8_9CORY|nr:hypothetical protein [Corynebacterium poyangense]MBZ8176846.1 hypothetical protein [Corynebacterium poyangense]QNQ89743.1 hypothetical protein GP475_03080 [Corynebacterium poyangense]